MWMVVSIYRDYKMKIETRFVQNVVLGSGAAGLNAASRLVELGVSDLVIVTEALKAGTSRNTGSDKQTYYKLSLAGSDLDSVRDLAHDLYNGRAVDGDIALCEAALSTEGFLRLAGMGVPFPKNRYGEYIGYKTDHDPHKRATSAGPYTSRFMTEALERDVKNKGIEILDGYQAIRLLAENDEIKGVLLLKRSTNALLALKCKNLVMATGGPAGIYKMSVYPESQFGATGLAFEIGAKGKNLTEWQYGLASVKPRWNVSGSYMQVLPRLVSIGDDGVEHEFLDDYPLSKGEMLSRIFLKGYQWPFDARKLEKGSSIIDILCYLELEKGRKVYLDYIHNPGNKPIDYSAISEEARTYLGKANAMGATPIIRLRQMNEPAYQFYLDRGVDLEKEYLEISLSAQHNNGGLSINLWWESNIKGLFPVGEAAASHGVYRPGGSALNAGQVGSTRASIYIAKHQDKEEKTPDISNSVEMQIEDMCSIVENAFNGSVDIDSAYDTLRSLMSINASAIRNREKLGDTLSKVEDFLAGFSKVKIDRSAQMWKLFEYRNALITARFYLYAMIEYIDSNGKSRGSSLYSDPNGAIHPSGLDDRFIYSLEDEKKPSLIQEVFKVNDSISCSYREPRPIPGDDDFFERVWARYREDGNVY